MQVKVRFITREEYIVNMDNEATIGILRHNIADYKNVAPTSVKMIQSGRMLTKDNELLSKNLKPGISVIALISDKEVKPQFDNKIESTPQQNLDSFDMFGDDIQETSSDSFYDPVIGDDFIDIQNILPNISPTDVFNNVISSVVSQDGIHDDLMEFINTNNIVSLAKSARPDLVEQLLDNEAFIFIMAIINYAQYEEEIDKHVFSEELSLKNNMISDEEQAKLDILLTLGFNTEVALQALRRANGNVEMAANMLLNNL